MRADIQKRIATLEGRFSRGPIVLHLANGSERRIRGDVQHWISLCRAMSDSTRHLADELEAIRDSVRIDEPAGLFNLLWALQHSPTAPDREEVVP